MSQDAPTPNDHVPDGDVSRRQFVQVCIAGCGVVSAGAVAYPVVAFLGRPASLEGSQQIKLPIAELSEDQARYVDLQGQQVAVLYTGKTPKAFSASCSHLGCIVAWDNIQHVFRCPCHGAVFDDHGKPIAGPVSKPLESVPFQIVEGNIVIG